MSKTPSRPRLVPLLAIVIASVSSAAVPAPAVAGPSCRTIITGTGRSSNVDGSADFAKYHGKVPARLAERRAIANWQFEVKHHCAGASSWWWRARQKSVDCEGSAGHVDCTARAIPRG